MGLFRRKPAEEPKKEPELKWSSKKLFFDVANSRGEKGFNENDDDIQEILDTIPKKIIRSCGDKLYGGYTKSDMKECFMDVVTIYQDFEFECDVVDYKVYLVHENKKWHVGNIAKKDHKEFDEALGYEKMSLALTIDGGMKKSVDGREWQTYNRPTVELTYWVQEYR